jgi:hypothetical protein
MSTLASTHGQRAALGRPVAWGLLAVSAATAVLVAVGASGPVVLALLVAFCLTAPGWAAVSFVRLDGAALEWAVATAVSLAVVLLLAIGMVSLGWWHPRLAVLGLALVTTGVLVHRIVVGPPAAVAPASAATTAGGAQ